MGDVRAFSRAPDGTETDITEGVQALYDLVISSMDFRSGFWTAEDAVPVAQLARLLGFEQREQIERYLAEQLHSEEQAAFWQAHPGTRAMQTPPHDHVFSSAGRCMWGSCKAREGEDAVCPGMEAGHYHITEPAAHHVGGFPSE
jgi:hypothetical protein